MSTGTGDSGIVQPNEDATAPSADAGSDVSQVDVVVVADAADASLPIDAAIPIDSAPIDAGPDVVPICSYDASVGAAQFVLGLSDPNILGGVTPDELVMAWTSVPDDGGTTVQWAERATTTDPFGAIQSLDPSLGQVPADKVSLSADGLRLVFPSADHTQVVEVSRPARGTAFATVTTAHDFVGVNPVSGPEGTPGIGPFTAPALSPNFTYWAFIQGANGILASRAIGGGEWTTPPLIPPGLAPPASSATTIAPTAWSSDDRTLFYWDQYFGQETMAWRDPFSFDIIATIPLGTVEQHAVPSGDCRNIYFSGTLGIFVEPRD